jgi:hypothetical protein
MSSPALRERQPICEKCSKLDTQCSACGMPVRTNYLKLDDGRLLCRVDSEQAVLTEREAVRVFEQTKRDLLDLLRGTGTLPDRNITVRLADSFQIDRLHQKQRSIHRKHLTMGLTQTRRLDPHRLEHTIYLLTGQGPARLAAVCAHEYAHTWLHENVPAERGLEGDTVEGFCELVAYRLMAQRNEEVEKRVILANAYTRGQIDLLVKAQENYQFWRVVEWIKTGRDAKIDPSTVSRILALKEPPPTEPLRWAAAIPTTVPDILTLRGITLSPTRRWALINDATLGPNEEARVRVGSSNVVVRCLEILDNAVVIQVRGSSERLRLALREN